MDGWSAIALTDLWTTISGSLRATLTRQQFETWFRGMRLRGVDAGAASGNRASGDAVTTATFTVPNDFTREWVETYFQETLRTALLDHTGEQMNVAIVVADDGPALSSNRGGSTSLGAPTKSGGPEHEERDPDAAPLGASGATEALQPPPQQRRESPARRDARDGNGRQGNARQGIARPGNDRQANQHGGRGHDSRRGQLFGHPRYPYFLSDVLLNDDYVFEHFVAGPSNQLAHAASLAVANAPAQAYNPLFLHGSVGLGKTHLLQAICHHVLARRPDARILYLSCETFVNQFISAVEVGHLDDFRYRYRHVDMLLIDDIHFLARKERTQEEFFHTFNTLYNSKKQIVLSCDSPPREIPTLEDRLVSRFKWGLVTEIEPPDHETRISIVRRKAACRGATLPDGVAELIADNVATNVRELEGAVLKVIGYASLTKRILTRELAEEALRDVIKPKERKVTLDTILRAVCEHYAVKPSDLTSKRRQKSISHPRQVCMYLARRLTESSLMEIGGQLGGRDHTTVMYANDRITAELATSPRLKEDLDAIVRSIRSGS